MVPFFIAIEFIITGEWAASIVGGFLGGAVSGVLMWLFVNRFVPTNAVLLGLTRDQQAILREHLDELAHPRSQQGDQTSPTDNRPAPNPLS